MNQFYFNAAVALRRSLFTHTATFIKRHEICYVIIRLYFIRRSVVGVNMVFLQNKYIWDSPFLTQVF